MDPSRQIRFVIDIDVHDVAATFTHMDAFGDLDGLLDDGALWPTTQWGRPIASGSNRGEDR